MKRWLLADRRKKAKRKVRSGHGDQWGTIELTLDCPTYGERALDCLMDGHDR